MHSQIPEPLRALVEQLARLPGLGPKGKVMKHRLTRQVAEGYVLQSYLSRGIFQILCSLLIRSLGSFVHNAEDPFCGGEGGLELA